MEASRAELKGCMRRSRPNSSRRASTWAGPTSAATATAACNGKPLACSRRGKCAAIAVLMNQVTANTNDSSTAVRRVEAGRRAGGCWGSTFVPRSVAAGGGAMRGSQALSGRPSSRCSAAQPRHAPRQPYALSIQAERGQPIVLAKPANSVTPVMALRAPSPYSRTSEAKAASYRPEPMAMPISAQAANRVTGPCASASAASASANTMLVASSTGRPPCRSIAWPASGPNSAETTSASENAAKTVGVLTPRSRAMGAASMAGR